MARRTGHHRWLQLGAASAGLGAALLGVGIPGLAAADTESPAASSAAQTESTESGPAKSEPSESESESESGAADTSAPSDAEERETDEDHVEAESNDRDRDRDEEPEAPAVVDADEAETEATDDTDVAEEDPLPVHAEPAAVSGSERPWATVQAPAPRRDPVENLVRSLVAGLPTPVRRSLFNEAPEVGGQVMLGGAAGEVITGRVEAVDPEGDRVVYRLGARPTAGSVVLGADGAWTYTPGVGFDGVDTFVIVADDTGSHINLLDVFWAPGTRSAVLVNQGAVTFDFSYTAGAEHWTADRRAALTSAAVHFADNFVVRKRVSLDYEVTGWESAGTGVLASASSGLTVPDDDFLETWVQSKLRTGVDPNGAAADGVINWNFAYPWAIGATVAPDELDFTTVVIHELMHSFGLLTMVQAAGANTGRYWTVYDSFISDSAGTRAVGANLTWNSALDPNLTGGNGGLYFTGPNAVAAHGSPIPLYVRGPWTASNVAHVSDDLDEVMNAGVDRGPGARVLSPVMVGILRDLGYVVITRPAA